MNPIVELDKVGICAPFRPGETILENADFSMEQGENCMLEGEVGSGKTQALMLCAGIGHPQSGQIRLFGRSIDSLEHDEMLGIRLKIGLVFEGDGRLFPDLSLGENILLPLRYHGCQDPIHESYCRRWIERLGLVPYLDMAPSEVRRHYCRRAALARALSLDPDLLLLDEVMTGLHESERNWWKELLEGAVATDRISTGSPRSIILASSEETAWSCPRFKKVHIRGKKLMVD